MRTPKPTLLIAATALAVFFLTNAPAQSLWRDDVAKPMFADKRATSVGDIVTILVQENTSATKKNNTTTAKESAVDAAITSFLYSPGASGLLTKGGTMPALKYDAKNSFAGGGSVDNSQKILASIAVKVIDVLPNKNLVIEGRRETSFSGEHQTAVLHGIVRQEDITANNNVFSYNIADAKVEINTKGTVDDSQRKGWFTRIWDKLTPF
jgi:flagellar L-ring protein precursor FlgH